MALRVAALAVDVPVEDDVEILRFLLELERSAGLGEDLGLYLAPHNEHRIVLARGLHRLVLAVAGPLGFVHVMALGFACLLALALWILRWGPEAPAARRWAALAVGALLFNLQQWECLAWATGASQYYPLLLLAAGALTLGAGGGRWRAAGAAALALLATLDMMAGLALFPVLAVQAWRLGRPRAAAAQLALGALATLLYLQGYARPDHHPSPWAALASPVATFDYFCSLLGATVSVDDVRVGFLARFAGLGLLIHFVQRVRTGDDRRQPVAMAMLLFLLLVMGMVTLGRAGFGLEQAFDSRYRMYANVYTAVALLVELRRWPAARRTRAAALAAATALLVSALSLPYHEARLRRHADFYARNLAEFALGRSPIPGPRAYSGIVRQALRRGIYRLPCDDLPGDLRPRIPACTRPGV